MRSRRDIARAAKQPVKAYTVLELVALLTRNTEKGKGGKQAPYEHMTPSRYMHALELLEEGHSSEVVQKAVNLINASAWLKMRPESITDVDLERMHREKPWETPQGRKHDLRRHAR